MEVFFDFFSFYYHLGTVSCQITFFKKLNNLSFSTKFYVFFWRLQCTKKLRNSPLCEPEWTSITNGSFLRFFLFLLPFRNSIMPNNIFFKKLNNLSFSTKFYVFFEDCNVPKNCEILHFVHGSEPQSQMEVFFDFFSFYYHLGTVSCQITFFKKLNNLSFSTKFYVFFWRLQCTKKLRNSPLCEPEWTSITNGSFLRFFLFLLPFRNSIMPNNIFSKNSIIWVFQRNFMFFLKIAMYQKIAKFSTLSTGVNLNHKWKFSSIFSLFITI